MMINKAKSVIIFHKKRGKKEIEKEENNFLGYPIKNTYKYLGIIIDSHLTFKDQLTAVREKIKKGIKILQLLKRKKV